MKHLALVLATASLAGCMTYAPERTGNVVKARHTGKWVYQNEVWSGGAWSADLACEYKRPTDGRLIMEFLVTINNHDPQSVFMKCPATRMVPAE